MAATRSTPATGPVPIPKCGAVADVPSGSEDHCRTFIRQSPNGIWRFEATPPIPVDRPEDFVLDALYSQTSLAECNDAFARTVGEERTDDVIGRRLNEFLVRDAPASDALLRAFIRGGFRLTGAESHEIDRDGTWRVFVNDLTGVIEDNRLLSVWCTRRDVTEAKQIEAELRAAKDAAEAASRAKSTFLANVSHEIRTPLNGVLGMAHLILQEDLSPAQQERVRVLKTSADSLLHVLNDLLDFSKMEAGKFQLSPVPFHLADQLGETVKSLALRAHEKGLQLSYYLEPGVPTVVLGDPDRLRQVLVNLIGNAIKFTDAGEVAVRVRVAAEECEAPGCSASNHGFHAPHSPSIALHFAVQDTGIGIPTDKFTAIFQPFEQADPATTRRFGGTGLGLAIVSRLASLMGGTVKAESEIGRGSTFHFTAQFETTGAAKAGISLPPQFSGLTALAVDRHPLSRGLLLEQLSSWGLDALGAADVDRGLAVVAAAGRPAELLILQAVSVADALESIQRFRACGAARNVIACVPSSESANAALADVGGLEVALLAKPFKPTELLETLIGALKFTPPAWLTGRRTESSPPAIPTPLRVLLAEDNAVNQAVAVGMLEAVGHAVRVVSTGRGVLAALAAEPFDVVLMDVQMPEMDGFEATAAIRAAEAGGSRRLPIVALTARAMADDRKECLRRGMDDFVAKPIQPRELYQVLGRFRPLPSAPLLTPSRQGTMVATEKVLDEAEFRARCGGREELVRQIARLFLSECPRYLERLRAALAAGDAPALGLGAHALKGAVGNLGAGASVAAVRRVEELAGTENLIDAPAALADLSIELDRLRLELRALVGRRVPDSTTAAPIAS